MESDAVDGAQFAVRNSEVVGRRGELNAVAWKNSASPPARPRLRPLLRHGFGTEMYRATKNLFAVMNVMGHTTVGTTMKYQHQNIDEVAAVASRRVQ
jgi:site-specific recombinase XerC